MFPTLIDLGVHRLPVLGETHIALPTYGVLFALGTVLAWIWFVRRCRRLGIPEDILFNLSFYTVLAGLLGAKLTLVLVEWRYYLAHPADILGTLRTAGVLIGGIVCAAIVFILYCRRRSVDPWPLADAAAAPLALAQAVGRLGCFAAGCCYGVRTDGPVAVTFHDPVAAEQTGVLLGVPLVPTQLIQMASDLFLAGLLTWLYRRGVRPAGTVFWIYALLYSVMRIVIEFWRGDTARGLWFGQSVSTSQILSAVGILLALFMLVRLRRREATGP